MFIPKAKGTKPSVVAPAEKDLGGTLNKNMSELEVKALPQNLPHEIIVDISKLATFDDAIMVKDIVLPKNVVATKNPDEVIASVLAPQKVEEELAAEITEDVESVEKVEKEKKVEDVVEEVKD
jgi:large subunit ribosomal protein L25